MQFRREFKVTGVHRHFLRMLSYRRRKLIYGTRRARRASPRVTIHAASPSAILIGTISRTVTKRRRYSTSFLLSINETKPGVLSAKEEIVRRATCKFVRNFRPPPALAPSRQEKRDGEREEARGGGGGGGGEEEAEAGATLEEDEEPGGRGRGTRETAYKKRRKKKKTIARMFSVPGSWRFMRAPGSVPPLAP